MPTAYLPPDPDLRQLKKQARDLLRAHQSGDAGVCSRLRAALCEFATLSDDEILQANFILKRAQYAVAREYGFEDWVVLMRHVQVVMPQLLEAQEAVRVGDLAVLQRAMATTPMLVHQRSEYNGNTLLHIAANHQQIAAVEFLIDCGADVAARAGEGWQPLHNAAGQGDVELLEVLLAAGAEPRTEACGDGGTALVHALSYGHYEAACLLAASTRAPDNLRVAAGLGLLDRIHALVPSVGCLAAGAGLHRGFYRHHAEFPSWSTTDDPQEILDEAMVYAAHNGRVEAVSLLCDKGASVNGIPYYATGLHQAVIVGNRPTVECLLALGADATIRDTMHGGRACDWAHFSPDPSLRAPLLAAAAQHDLVAAVELGQFDQVELLAQRAPPVDLTDAYKQAVEGNMPGIATLLLRCGAVPTLFDHIDLGDVAAVEGALANGADPSGKRVVQVERMGSGLTAVQQSTLQAAAAAQRPDICDMLAATGASVDFYIAAFLNRPDELHADSPVDAPDAFGMTALHRAVEGGALAAVERLLALGADVHASSDTYTFGGRAMHVAAKTAASPQMLDLLIAAGADVNEGMNTGRPLAIAERYGQEGTADLLRERGAR